MAVKEEIPFENFLAEVSPQYVEFVTNLHDYLLTNGCKLKIETAKNGYVVSYSYAKTKRVFMNFVFRKSGLIARIYGDNVNKYIDFMQTLPAEMNKAIDKAPICKRLLDPTACNSRCSMGYAFEIGGNTYLKCKYNCFMFGVNDENIPFIKTFIENEIKERNK